MKKILKMFILVLTLSMVAPEFCPQFGHGAATVSAAAKTVQETLNSGKDYKYNLDKSGGKETVRFVKTAAVYPNYQGEAVLYINNKIVYSKKLNRDSGDVRVVVQDTKKSDKQMEVLVFEGYFSAWAGDLSHIYYYRYKKGKTSKVQDLAKVVESKYGKDTGLDLEKSKFGQLASIHPKTDKKMVSVDGKGTLSYKVCLYFDYCRLDYAHFYDKLTLKKGKFVKSKTKNFKLADEEMTYYVSEGKNKVYKRAGGSKVAFTLKDNEKFYRTGIYRAGKNKVYIKIKTESGKKGYIKASSVKLQEYGTFHV